MHHYKVSLVVCFLLLLSACSKPLPADKQEYVGHWSDGDGTISLVIHASGEVNYERKTGSTSVELNAPIKEFEGDNFVVGISFMTTVFKVSEPPNKKEGIWQMVVDDVRLTRDSSQP